MFGTDFTEVGAGYSVFKVSRCARLELISQNDWLTSVWYPFSLNLVWNRMLDKVQDYCYFYYSFRISLSLKLRVTVILKHVSKLLMQTAKCRRRETN